MIADYVVGLPGGRAKYVYYDRLVPPTSEGHPGDQAECWGTGAPVSFFPRGHGGWPASGITPPAGPPGPSIATWAPGAALTAGAVVAVGNVLLRAVSAHTAAADIRTDIAAGRILGVAGSSQSRIEPAIGAGPLSASTLAPAAANTWYYARLRGTGPVSKLRLDIGVGGANVTVGVWRNNGSDGVAAAPSGAPIATSASTAVAAGTQNAAQDFSLGGTVGVLDGDWWGFAADSIATLTLAAYNAFSGAWGRAGGLAATEQTAGYAVPANASPTSPRGAKTFWVAGIA